MIDLKLNFDQKAYEVDGQSAPIAKQADPLAEVYPAYPSHTGDKNYFADQHKDKDENLVCQLS